MASSGSVSLVILLSLIAALSFPVPSVAPASGTGDPHFVGAHGTRYDFNGEVGRHYCLIADKNLQVNALFKGYKVVGAEGESEKTVRTWMGEVGFTWTEGTGVKRTLQLAARKGADKSCPGLLAHAALDGVQVALPSSPGVAANTNSVRLEFKGTKNAAMALCSEQWGLTLEGMLQMDIDVDSAGPDYELPDDAMNHFSFRIRRLENTEAVHGVLGQTFRNTPLQILKTIKYKTIGKMLRQPVQADGSTGLGFLDGNVKDYEASGLVNQGCKFSSFL